LKDSAQAKDPAQLSDPEDQTPGLGSVTTAAVAPTREDIKTAYQSALQGGAPRAVAVAEPVIPADAIRHLDPDEIASSLKRADALIASGDLAAARLVLRRAADAGDARAAMTLGETYDPAVLEKLGVHGVVPDLAMARGWYEKAKQFGATEATLSGSNCSQAGNIDLRAIWRVSKPPSLPGNFCRKQPSPTEFRTRPLTS